MRTIKCGGMCAAPWRLLSAPLEMAPIITFGAFLITALTTSKSGATARNFIVGSTTFNLLYLPFKFGLKITHQKILMAFNFGLAI